MDALDQEQFQEVVESLHDGLYVVDEQRCVLFWNKAAERITGFCKEEVVGRSCKDNVLCHVDENGSQLCLAQCPLSATIEHSQNREAEVYLHHKAGHRVPVLVRTSPRLDASGHCCGAIELFTDMSSGSFLWERFSELQKVALIDPVLELPNRRFVQQQLQSQLAQLKRFHLPFGVAQFRIPQYGARVREYGEDSVLQLRQVLAATIRRNLRPYDFMGIWDVDEFCGIFPNMDHGSLRIAAGRIASLLMRSAVRGPVENVLQFPIELRLAIAESGDSLAKLLERVDHSPLVNLLQKQN